MFGLSRKILLLTVFTGLYSSTGCATLIQGRHQELTINSNPPGATFEVAGISGTTPGTVSLERKEKHHTISIRKPGYETAQVRVGRELNPWIAGNLLLSYAFPIGFAVDFYTGSAYKFDTDNVQVNLAPQQESLSQSVTGSGLSTPATAVLDSQSIKRADQRVTLTAGDSRRNAPGDPGTRPVQNDSN
jgi:hypothetical protein